jgi:hypothetical protein
MRAAWVAGVLVGLLLVDTTSAHAAPDTTHVLVRFAGGVPSAEGIRLTSAIRGQLSDTATVDIAGAGAGGAPLCVIEIDQTAAGLVVRFADRDGRPAGAARTVARTGELGASEVATIVRAFVLAAATSAAKPAGATGGGGAMNAASTAAPTDAESAKNVAAEPEAENVEPGPIAIAAPVGQGARPAETGVANGGDARAVGGADRAAGGGADDEMPSRARVGAFYTAATYASQLPWQSGARVEAAYSFWQGIYGGVGYAFHPSRDVTGPDGVVVGVSRHAASLFAGIERGKRFVLGADAGVGLDQTVRGAARTPAGFVPTGESSNVGPTFALRLHARWRAPGGGGLGLDIAPAFEVAPLERAMVVQGPLALANSSRDPGASVLLAPTTARLRLDIGGTFDGF